MANVTTSINSMLDSAVTHVGPIRQRIYKKLLKNQSFRDKVVDVIVLKSAEENFSLGNRVTMGEGTFNGDTELLVDEADFKAWLDFIIKNLPTIISIILMFI